MVAIGVGESVQIAIGVIIGVGIVAYALFKIVQAIAVMSNSAEGVDADDDADREV
jgi:hypothetical protein